MGVRTNDERTEKGGRRMTKQGVLQRINTIIDGKCGSCPRRISFYQSKADRGKFSMLDTYCNKQCHVGTELQMLGRML